MSNNQSEYGTIVLPSAEFAKVRQAVQQSEAERLGDVYDLTQEFWKGLTRKQQTNANAYREAVWKWTEAKSAELDRVIRSWRGTEADRRKHRAMAHVHEALEVDWRTGKPARVLKSDMEFPTNRTTMFSGPDFALSFDKGSNTVTWEVPDNNRAVEDAHAHPAAANFFAALAHVRWTRGTGGVFTGNDEYNRDDGDGGDYVTRAFGPVGAERAVGHCEPYLDSKGNRVTRRDLQAIRDKRIEKEMADREKERKAYAKSVKASGAQPRGHNGHPGQYTYRRNGEAGFRL